jgi:2-hydroxycyclohexanecarboxyl-CoA dehydrogenase
MGEETCYELARRGHKVAVLDINEQEAKRVADAIGDHNAAAIGLGLGVDVTDRPAVESAL